MRASVFPSILGILSGALLLPTSQAQSQQLAAQQSLQRCDTVSSRTSAAELSGMRVRSVTVRTSPPKTLPGRAGELVSRLHSTSRPSTILRDVPIVPGDTVDTLVVSESMRRLRQRSYLANTQIVGARCGNDDNVDLTLVSSDKWSLNPSFSSQAGSSYGGVEERNLFGTGRTGSLSIASREGRVGGSLGYTDAYLLNLPMYLRMRLAEYGDGDEIRARLRNTAQSIQDVWSYQVTVSRYRRDTNREEAFGGDQVLVAQAFDREGAYLLVGRRIGDVGTSANSILFGADFERASLNAPDNSLTVGPNLVERRYHGPAIGFARRAAMFDTVGWLAERQVLVDVPLGVEMEGLVSGGREDVSREPAAYGSVWIGKMWIPGTERLASLDFWSSGYHIEKQVNFAAASTRALASYYARNGSVLYSARLAAEKLVNPDPDVQALQTFDPTLPVIPDVYRLSENAMEAEFERATHVRSPLSVFNVDAAVFTAGSYRTASALSQHDHFGVAVIGAGLRLLPASQGSGSLRLDLLCPAFRSPGARNGVTFAVSVAPWLQANRQRDDPRLR
jgi:hypothetical protein